MVFFEKIEKATTNEITFQNEQLTVTHCRFSDKLDTLTWQQVNRWFKGEYPNILHLFDLIDTIPASSTICE